MNRRCRLLLSSLSLSGLAVAALSAPGAAFATDELFNVPVAGTLQPNRLITYMALGTNSVLDSNSSTLLATVDYNLSRYFSAGITSRLTDGVSVRPEGSVQFAPAGKPYAFAAGFASVGVRTFRSQPYVVASTHFDALGMYVGATHDSYGEHPMLGASYMLPHGFSVQGDWIYDDAHFLTVGGRYQFGRTFAVSAGFSHAESERGGNGVFAAVQKDFRL